MPKTVFSLKNGNPFNGDMLNDRGFNYGDGFFETMRVSYGFTFLWEEHCQRIYSTAKLLGLNIISDDLMPIRYYMEQQLKKIPLASCKIIFTRQQNNSRGSYGCRDCPANIYVIAKVFTDRDYQNGAVLKVANQPLADNPSLAGIKSLSRLHYILCANSVDYANDEHVLFYRNSGQLVETMHHNIFIVKNDTIYTPCLSAIGVSGVMRCFLLSHENNLFGKIQVEKNLFVEDLYSADEVFITNALDGIIPVAHIITDKSHIHYSSQSVSLEFRNRLKSFYAAENL